MGGEPVGGDAVHTLRISSPPDDVNTVHNLLELVWRDSPQIRADERLRFEMALIELASNVMRHADAGTGVSCTVTIEMSPHEIRATLSDTGEVGQIELTNRSMPDEFAESGRGIPLVQALVDELRFDREGGLNHWHISRRIVP